jgi:hypothetical protein
VSERGHRARGRDKRAVSCSSCHHSPAAPPLPAAPCVRHAGWSAASRAAAAAGSCRRGSRRSATRTAAAAWAAR